MIKQLSKRKLLYIKNYQTKYIDLSSICKNRFIVKFRFVGQINCPCKYYTTHFHIFQPLFQSNPHRHNLINIRFALRLCNPHKLLMALPQIHQKPERHKPHLFRSKVQLRRSVIEQPGEQFCVIHSAVTAFFEVSSLSMLRFVPFSIASVIASLYSASSPGEVRSSTVSSVRSGFLSLFLRLCISML